MIERSVASYDDLSATTTPAVDDQSKFRRTTEAVKVFEDTISQVKVKPRDQGLSSLLNLVNRNKSSEEVVSLSKTSIEQFRRKRPMRSRSRSRSRDRGRSRSYDRSPRFRNYSRH